MKLKENSNNLSINNLFFELTQVALGNRVCLSHTPSADEWGKLYDMAKKQSLVGVCFAGVQRLQLQEQCRPKMLYLTWVGMAAKIQQKNEVVNRQCVDLQKRLSADGFRSYIMKGQAVAALYQCGVKNVENGSESSSSIASGASGAEGASLSALRQSGDIDIFLEGGFEKVNEYVQRTYPTKEINELEIHYPCFPDTEVEIHFKPFVMDGPKDKILQRFFDSCKEENFSNKVSLGFTSTSSAQALEFQKVSEGPLEIFAPTLKFNLVHQLVHIHHHLFYEGVGMRQLMDYYFVLRAANKEVSSFDSAQEPGFKFQKVSGGSNVAAEPVEVREVKKVVSNLGLDSFASALMWVLGHVFGLPEEEMPWKPNEEDGRFLLEEILQSGNFGRQDERQRGLYDSKWNSFWMVHIKTFRMWRFDHWAWLWNPIWRIKGFVWRKLKGYK